MINIFIAYSFLINLTQILDYTRKHILGVKTKDLTTI